MYNYSGSDKMKNKIINIIVITILILSIVGLTISIKNIIIWNKDKKNTEKQIHEIEKIVKIQEVTDTDSTEIINQDTIIDEVNPYWDYIKMNMIYADFSELKLINNNTLGWIQVNGTNINYPFVQTSDNNYYLTHSFDKSYNQAGWVFLDYRNNLKDDKNTIIYAHGRLDNSMFGSLRNILTNGWLNNTNNHVIRLSTEIENTLWQVFSTYRIPTTSDYIQTEFSSDESYLKWLNLLLNRSAYNFNTTISSSDKILTLSTCFDDNDKIVLHAKLIKRETR